MSIRRHNKRRLRLEPLEPRVVLDSTVVFNEIMYHPADNDAAGEWIELHNQMSVDMDLSGWRLDDAVDFAFPKGTVIGGGSYLVVAADPAAMAAAGYADALGPYTGRLSNGGERVELVNNNGRWMDRVDYDDYDPEITFNLGGTCRRNNHADMERQPLFVLAFGR